MSTLKRINPRSAAALSTAALTVLMAAMQASAKPRVWWGRPQPRNRPLAKHGATSRLLAVHPDRNRRWGNRAGAHVELPAPPSVGKATRQLRRLYLRQPKGRWVVKSPERTVRA